jgi:iron complex outermembrane receptor protein
MRKIPLLLGGTILAAAASPAFAQTTVDGPAAEEVAPAEGDAAATEAAVPEDSGRLDEIVVTALRRTTNLQRTPISISVLSADDLRDRHIQSLGDLSDGSIPGLRVTTFEARQSALTIGIRGIVPLDANQPAREQGVGV